MNASLVAPSDLHCLSHLLLGYVSATWPLSYLPPVDTCLSKTTSIQVPRGCFPEHRSDCPPTHPPPNILHQLSNTYQVWCQLLAYMALHDLTLADLKPNPRLHPPLLPNSLSFPLHTFIPPSGHTSLVFAPTETLTHPSRPIPTISSLEMPSPGPLLIHLFPSVIIALF